MNYLRIVRPRRTEAQPANVTRTCADCSTRLNHRNTNLRCYICQDKHNDRMLWAAFGVTPAQRGVVRP